MSQPPPPPSSPFSRQMRQVTRQAHKTSDTLVNAKLVFGKCAEAEPHSRQPSNVLIPAFHPSHTYFSSDYCAALSDPAVWLDGLVCFHPIFQYLEQHIADTALLPVAVHRSAAIESDIRHYCDQLQLDADQQLAERRPSVRAYLAHLDAVRAENPVLLFAYAYHLYMGMLSGGLILNKKRRTFAALSLQQDVSDDGYRMTMYEEPVGRLKAGLRSTADEMVVDERTRQRLLQESVRVFELNNAIVHSIRGGGRVVLRKAAVAVGAALLAVFVYRVLARYAVA